MKIGKEIIQVRSVWVINFKDIKSGENKIVKMKIIYNKKTRHSSYKQCLKESKIDWLRKTKFFPTELVSICTNFYGESRDAFVVKLVNQVDVEMKIMVMVVMVLLSVVMIMAMEKEKAVVIKGLWCSWW